MMYWFELWREWKISIAEIFSILHTSELIYISEKICILDEISDEDIQNFTQKCGGTIKVFIIDTTFDDSQQWKLLASVFSYLTDNHQSGKIEYGVNFFGERVPKLGHFLSSLKVKLKDAWFSSRFLNQNFANLNSAIIFGQKLVETGYDINIIFTKQKVFVGKTIWIQNIEEYSKRDFWKKRDMQVWMLPPKLAQMMINIASSGKENVKIYDPFCWLWTILIESVMMWYKDVYGTDIEAKMVQSTKNNLDFIEETFWIDNIRWGIFLHDARQIDTSIVFQDTQIDAIVSEWYLWDVLSHQTISWEKIKSQRNKLTPLYEDFFKGLQKIQFSWTIVICFPFWEFRKKYFYFEEWYKILEKYCVVQKLIPKNHFARESLSGSLLYKRSEQLVWREIFKLAIKPQ